MIQYPVAFYAEAFSQPGTALPWVMMTSDFSSSCAIPKDFKGPGGAASPEDLFNLALINCFIGTFKVLAENSKVSYEAVSVSADLQVDVNDNKQAVMKECTLSVTIKSPSSIDRAKIVAEKAFKSGFILNSVLTKINLNLAFE